MEIRASLMFIYHLIKLNSPVQDKAYEPSQKYKEGKYILERNLLTDVQ